MMTTAVSTQRYGPEFNLTSMDNFTSFMNATIASLYSQDGGEEVEEITRAVSISVFASFTFIFVVGLIGNILVVTGETLFFSPPQIHSNTQQNHFILNRFFSPIPFLGWT